MTVVGMRIWREYGMWRFRFRTANGNTSTHRGDFWAAFADARHLKRRLRR